MSETTKSSTQPEFLSRRAFAAVLGVGVSTFDRMRAAGKVGPKAVALAGVKFHRREVDAWMATRDSAGELYDAKTWPAVWQAVRDRKPVR